MVVVGMEGLRWRRARRVVIFISAIVLTMVVAKRAGEGGQEMEEEREEVFVLRIPTWSGVIAN